METLEILKKSYSLKEIGLKITILLLKEYSINELKHLAIESQLPKLIELGIYKNGKIDTNCRPYIALFGKLDDNFNSLRVAKKLMSIFAGKIGTFIKDNKVVTYLLNSSRAEVVEALNKFIEEYPDVKEKEIEDATKKYIEVKDKDEKGNYKGAAKLVNFIYSEKQYLYNYIELSKSEVKKVISVVDIFDYV